MSLHYVAYHGHLDMMKYLVDEEGLDVESRHRAMSLSRGGTAHEIAVSGGHMEVVKWLVNEKEVIVNAKPPGRSDILEAAVCRGQLDIIKWFIDHGKVDTKVEWLFEKMTIPQAAFGYNQTLEIVKWLVEGKHVDIDWMDEDGFAAFHYAIFLECLETAWLTCRDSMSRQSAILKLALSTPR